MSFVRSEHGFKSDLIDMRIRAAYSNLDMGHMVLIDTPSGQVQVYVSPKGRRTRVWVGDKELKP